jgi:RyR domain
MKLESIAKVCHQANKAYCEGLDDFSQVDWEHAPQWQRDSAVNGVTFTINNPDAPPSASHDSWLKEKLDAGWKYGKEKDAEKKEHPCCVPYDELPESQKIKDVLFQSIVKSIFKDAK